MSVYRKYELNFYICNVNTVFVSLPQEESTPNSFLQPTPGQRK